MSLLTTASPWTNEDTNNSSKKRTPTLRKTAKVRPDNDYASFQDDDEPANKMPPTISEVQSSNDARQARVNDMLNKITATQADNKLADFTPPSMPQMTAQNPNQLSNLNTGSNTSGNYTANDLGNYSSYKTSYEQNKMSNVPYYAKMGIGPTDGSSIADNKLMEKINYMIHLLEEQQYERTANITEEFILYTFLGVFMIFIVDSFARAGKYTR
jgi:hypothetical protein